MKLICDIVGENLVFSIEKCGMKFPNVAKIFRFREENPLMVVPEPIGISALSVILAKYKELVE